MVFRCPQLVLTCASGFLLVSATATFGQSDTHRLLVVFQNVAKARADLIAQAQTEVSRLFSDIGIEIDWAGQMPPDYEGVRMLALTNWEPGRDRAPDNVMGFTQTVPEGRGTRAYVLMPRVLRTAQKYNVELVKLLAVAMAHELGHTLLPDGSHAANGIMRAPFDYVDLQAVKSGRFRFSEESASLIRRGLIE